MMENRLVRVSSTTARIVASTLVCLAGGFGVAALLTVNAIVVSVFRGPAALGGATVLGIAGSYFGVAGIAGLVYGPLRAFLPTLLGAIVAGAIAGGLGFPVLLHACGASLWEWPWILIGVVGGAWGGSSMFRDLQPPSAYQRWLQERNLDPE